MFKFAAVSVGYTIVWMALCSELNTFRELYGPSILLKMNIVYYLPSIPLLILSSYVDEPLDKRFGVAMTVLMRLLIGNGTCAIIAIIFPFEPDLVSHLLWTVAALGVAHGISFSASYQLTSKYANKNTIALGLGCVGSGALVLVLEVALQIGAHPSTNDELALYFCCAGAVAVALVSAVSLLLRHWRSIEAASMGLAATGVAQQQYEDSLRHGLLQEDVEKNSPSDASAAGVTWCVPAQRSSMDDRRPIMDNVSHADTHSRTSLDLDAVSASSSGPPRNVARRNSVHAMLALSPLDFFKSVSDGESTLLLDGHTFEKGAATRQEDPALQAAIAAEGGSHRPSFDTSRRSLGRDPPVSGRSRLGMSSRVESASGAQPHSLHGGSSGNLSPDTAAAAGTAPSDALQLCEPNDRAALPTGSAERVGGHESHLPPSGSDGNIDRMRGASSSASLYSATSAPEEPQPTKSALHVMHCMWPCQLSLFISGSTTLAIFPLVTYVPTSGTLGTLLPKWLFFVRLFADLAGRLLPRLRLLAVQHPFAVLTQALMMVALTPLFYLYIIFAPTWFLSDTVACVYIATVFLLNGMVNTNVYVLVPRLVKSDHKALAAGLLAVTFQGAHVIGLLAGASMCLTILD